MAGTKGLVAVVALGVALLALFLFVVLLDILAAATLFPEVLALFVATGALLAALALLAGRRRAVLVAAGCYLAALLALRWVALSPVKPFRAFYAAIEPGMTRAAVQAELDRRFPLPGRFPRPVLDEADDGNLWLTLDPTRGEYNSEFVRIAFRGGLTAGKEYLGD